MRYKERIERKTHAPLQAFLFGTMRQEEENDNGEKEKQAQKRHPR